MASFAMNSTEKFSGVPADVFYPPAVPCVSAELLSGKKADSSEEERRREDSISGKKKIEKATEDKLKEWRMKQEEVRHRVKRCDEDGFFLDCGFVGGLDLSFFPDDDTRAMVGLIVFQIKRIASDNIEQDRKGRVFSTDPSREEPVALRELVADFEATPGRKAGFSSAAANSSSSSKSLTSTGVLNDEEFFPVFFSTPTNHLYCLRKVYEHVDEVLLQEPYVAGFLAFREFAHYAAALEKYHIYAERTLHITHALQRLLVFVDGNGVLHPKQLGIAAHIGVNLGVTAVGVSKNLHLFPGLRSETQPTGVLSQKSMKEEVFAKFRKKNDDDDLPPEASPQRNVVYLRMQDADLSGKDPFYTASRQRAELFEKTTTPSEEHRLDSVDISMPETCTTGAQPGYQQPGPTVLGAAVAAMTREVERTGQPLNPIFVSPGHGLTVPTALRLVEIFQGDFRIPIPTRMADLRSRNAIDTKVAEETRW